MARTFTIEHRQKLSEAKIGIKSNATRHGMSGTRLYGVWQNMMTRCYNVNNDKYDYYGGRGIKVAREWHDAKNFIVWAQASGYKQGLQLDRKNNDGNYCPNNCRFVTSSVNARNRSSVVLLMYKGKTKCLTEWCRILNLNYDTTRARIVRYRWSVEKAFETPMKRRWHNNGVD